LQTDIITKKAMLKRKEQEQFEVERKNNWDDYVIPEILPKIVKKTIKNKNS
jgi:hypothetical protein